MSANAPETANDSAGAKARARTPSSGRALPRRLTWALTVLAFTAIAAVAIYALSLIWEAALLLLLSALLAYFIYPLTELLRRRLKRPLAITVAYLLVAGLLALVVWIVASSVVRQVSSLAHTITFLLSPAGKRQLQPIIGLLSRLDISSSQVAAVQNQLLSQVLGALSGLLPFLIAFFGNIINIILRGAGEHQDQRRSCRRGQSDRGQRHPARHRQGARAAIHQALTPGSARFVPGSAA
jgi:AI-2E family transporter